MSDFGAQVRQWTQAVKAMHRDAFTNVAAATKASITDGSLVTGSPGQPVQTGRLKASWVLAFIGPNEARISTNVIYAPFIEEGISGRGKALTLRSPVGGFHSVHLTMAGFDQLVADVLSGPKGEP